MSMSRYVFLAAACLSVSLSGCAVPYYTNLTKSIHAIRVLDAESKADVPEAMVSLTSETSVRFLGPPPCSLRCPDLFEIRSALASGGDLKRNADGSFHVPYGCGKGSHGVFAGKSGDANQYPRGIVVAQARGYRPAMLRYTAGRIEPGFSCDEMNDPDVLDLPPDIQPEEAAAAFRGNRCEFGTDGILRLYLRRYADRSSAPASSPATERSSSISGQ